MVVIVALAAVPIVIRGVRLTVAQVTVQAPAIVLVEGLLKVEIYAEAVVLTIVMDVIQTAVKISVMQIGKNGLTIIVMNVEQIVQAEIHAILGARLIAHQAVPVNVGKVYATMAVAEQRVEVVVVVEEAQAVVVVVLAAADVRLLALLVATPDVKILAKRVV